MAKKGKKVLKVKTAKKSATNKVATKKPMAKKTAAKKLAAKKSTAKKATAKKAITKKITANKVNAKKTKIPSTASLEKMFHPLYDRVLVLRDSELEKTAGGLFIPNTVQDKPNRGKVLAVGKGVLSKKGHIRPMDVKVGDAVLFSHYTGTEVVIDGQPLLLVKEDEILGIEEK